MLLPSTLSTATAPAASDAAAAAAATAVPTPLILSQHMPAQHIRAAVLLL